MAYPGARGWREGEQGHRGKLYSRRGQREPLERLGRSWGGSSGAGTRVCEAQCVDETARVMACTLELALAGDAEGAGGAAACRGTGGGVQRRREARMLAGGGVCGLRMEATGRGGALVQRRKRRCSGACEAQGEVACAREAKGEEALGNDGTRRKMPGGR